MATARDILTRSLRSMGVLSEYEDMTADQGAAGLATLDELMFGFNVEGINYAHSTLATLDTTLNVPDDLLRSVRLLAVRDLAESYGYQPTPQMAAQIAQAKLALQAHYHIAPKAVIDRGLLKARRGSFDITRG